MQIAARCGSLQIISLLIQEGADVNARDDDGQYALTLQMMILLTKLHSGPLSMSLLLQGEIMTSPDYFS